jgi:hypothetical protein
MGHKGPATSARPLLNTPCMNRHSIPSIALSAAILVVCSAARAQSVAGSPKAAAGTVASTPQLQYPNNTSPQAAPPQLSPAPNLQLYYPNNAAPGAIRPQLSPASNPQQPTTLAPDSREHRDQPEEGKRSWYGWQTMLVVSGSVAPAVVFISAGYPNGSTIALAAGGVYLGPAVVHWAHGNIGKGFISLGMGVGSTLVGAALGAALYQDKERDAACEQRVREKGGMDLCGLDTTLEGIAIGSLIGAATYLVVDTAALAYESAPEPKETTVARTSVHVIPRVSVNANQASVGLGGVF